MNPFNEKKRSLLVRQARRMFTALLRRGATRLDEKILHAPAIVFSPHPDDESLGCGGLIIKKREAGARVVVVFVTDGRASHSNLLDSATLVDTRAREAVEACRVLGVPREDVLFLNATDGVLLDQWRKHVPEVVELLDRYQPAQVFVTHRREPRADHLGAYRLVDEATRQWNRPLVFFEYLVWYWNHWPWAVKPVRQLRDLAGIPWTVWSGYRMVTALLRNRRVFLDVSDVLDRKRLALEQHRTQMDRPEETPEWLTLRDVWDGGFLAASFQDYEYFECRQCQPTHRPDAIHHHAYADHHDRQPGPV